MSSPGISVVLQQLAYHAPMLLVYLVGFILALSFLGRTRLPSLLTLIATGGLILTSIATIAIHSYLMNAAGGPSWSPLQVAQAMSVVGIVGSLIRAAAFGLLLAAVFIDRHRTTGETLGPPRFSLRAMLIVMTVVAVLIGLMSAVYHLRSSF
jgi:hypothetical protein